MIVIVLVCKFDVFSYVVCYLLFLIWRGFKKYFRLDFVGKGWNIFVSYIESFFFKDGKFFVRDDFD